MVHSEKKKQISQGKHEHLETIKRSKREGKLRPAYRNSGISYANGKQLAHVKTNEKTLN